MSVGGGSVTGLGKALRLDHALLFFAVPTTYAGSEMTAIYGITREVDKRTGRDERVRPDAVFYVPEFSAGMPLPLKIKSLLNALAHPVSALSTESLAEENRRQAHETIGRLVRAALQLAETPDQTAAQEDALRGASRAGAILDEGKLGLHHRLAHFLGGRFNVEHGALHAALLPHSLRRMRSQQPAIYEGIERAAGVPDLPAQLFELLRRVGADVSLQSLGADYVALIEALSERSEMPADLLQAVFHGRSPARRWAWVDWGLRQPVTLSGAAVDAAEVIVLAIHAESGAAEAVAQQVWEAAGHGGNIAVVAPQAPNNLWYSERSPESVEEVEGPREVALAELDRVVERIRASNPNARLVVWGISQGACLAGEYVARRGSSVDGLVALSGARIGLPADPSGRADFAGMPAVFGSAEDVASEPKRPSGGSGQRVPGLKPSANREMSPASRLGNGFERAR